MSAVLRADGYERKLGHDQVLRVSWKRSGRLVV